MLNFVQPLNNKKMKKTTKVRIKTTPTRLVFALALAAIVACCVLPSCNVTRTVTTQSQYFSKGDTTCTIITKTIESYDATKR